MVCDTRTFPFGDAPLEHEPAPDPDVRVICRRPLLRGAPPPLDAPPFIICAAAEVRVPEARSISIRRLHEVVHVHHPRKRRPVPMLKVQGADLVGEAFGVRYHNLVAGVGPGNMFFLQHARELLDEGWDGAARWLPAWWRPFHLGRRRQRGRSVW